MRSEALDITIESRGNAVWLILSGPFHNEQIPNIREKINGLLEDANRRLVVDLEQVTSVGDQVAQLFVVMASLVKGKGGSLKLIFKNTAVTAAFTAYRNILDIYANAQMLSHGGFWGILRYRSSLLSKKTGVRLSRPVAFFLLFVLSGWFLSLAFIVQLQNHRIHKQEQELHGLVQWKQDAELEVQNLRDRLRPMEQLGLLKDAPKPHGKAPAAVKSPKPSVVTTEEALSVDTIALTDSANSLDSTDIFDVFDLKASAAAETTQDSTP